MFGLVEFTIVSTLPSAATPIRSRRGATPMLRRSSLWKPEATGAAPGAAGETGPTGPDQPTILGLRPRVAPPPAASLPHPALCPDRLPDCGCPRRSANSVRVGQGVQPHTDHGPSDCGLREEGLSLVHAAGPLAGGERQVSR